MDSKHERRLYRRICWTLWFLACVALFVGFPMWGDSVKWGYIAVGAVFFLFGAISIALE